MFSRPQGLPHERPGRRRAPARWLGPSWLVAAVLLCAAAAGCKETRRCAPAESTLPAFCIGVDLNAFEGRRYGGIALGIVACLLAGLAAATCQPVGALLALGVLAGGGLGAHRLWPKAEDDPAPAALAQHRAGLLAAQAATAATAAAAVQAAVAEAQAAAEHARQQAADPRVQLGNVKNAHQRLTLHLRKRLRPLLQRYQQEHRRYRPRLAAALRRAGAESHEALRRAGVKQRATLELLERTALLDYSLAELGRQAESAHASLFELEALAWRLEKVAELEEVAAGALGERLRATLASADALLGERLRPPERVDLAAREARLFSELSQVKRGATARTPPPQAPPPQLPAAQNTAQKGAAP